MGAPAHAATKSAAGRASHADRPRRSKERAGWLALGLAVALVLLLAGRIATNTASTPHASTLGPNPTVSSRAALSPSASVEGDESGPAVAVPAPKFGAPALLASALAVSSTPLSRASSSHDLIGPLGGGAGRMPRPVASVGETGTTVPPSRSTATTGAATSTTVATAPSTSATTTAPTTSTPSTTSSPTRSEAAATGNSRSAAPLTASPAGQSSASGASSTDASPTAAASAVPDGVSSAGVSTAGVSSAGVGSAGVGSGGVPAGQASGAG
ncbi:MAG: hypothetical protein JWM85_536 [Acidimicrobiaceae bacterium]|nr:hypothetical protein [Acidimicrobiaceae bacterium]